MKQMELSEFLDSRYQMDLTIFTKNGDTMYVHSALSIEINAAGTDFIITRRTKGQTERELLPIENIASIKVKGKDKPKGIVRR